MVAIEQVPKADVSKYGIIDPESTQGTIMKVKAIVEKPFSREGSMRVVGDALNGGG